MVYYTKLYELWWLDLDIFTGCPESKPGWVYEKRNREAISMLLDGKLENL